MTSSHINDLGYLSLCRTKLLGAPMPILHDRWEARVSIGYVLQIIDIGLDFYFFIAARETLRLIWRGAPHQQRYYRD